jgi:hypothetical protein
MSRYSVNRALVAGVLAAVVLSCSSDDDDPNGPGPGGVGATETIGPAGGTVAATLDDGSAISLSIPAGALADLIDISLEPAPIEGTQLTAFTLSPAGVRLAQPATLVVTLDDRSALSATSVVVFEQNGLRIPVNSTPNLAAGTVTASLELLGIPAVTSPAAPSGPARVSVLRMSGGGNGNVQNLNSSQRAQDAQAALTQLQTLGTVTAGDAMQIVMGAFIGLEASPETDPLFPSLVAGWRQEVCTNLVTATNAMNSFNFVSDYVGLERVMLDVVGWSILVNGMTASLAQVGEQGCSGGPPNPEAAIDAKLTLLVPLVANDLNSFVLLPSPRDSVFHADRLRPLLNLAAAFALIDFSTAVNSITALLPPQAVRLREAGYADCLAGNKQSIQGRLIRLEAVQGVFTAISPYDVQQLEDDIENCGMQVTYELEDARGLLLAGNPMGGGALPGEIQPVTAATVSGGGILRFSGVLRALRCPEGLSANNEQLQVQAGRNNSFSTVATLTPSNSDRYLEVSPLEVAVTDLRSAAGVGALDTATVQVILTRTGGDCGGQFATLVHSPVGTINLHFLGPDLTDSWEGTLITSSSRTFGVVLNIQQSETVAGGLYLVLNNHQGPAGGFQATYDGIKLTDIVMTADSFCVGGGFTATSLFITETTITGSLTATNCVTQGPAQLSLTRRNAAVLNGPFSGVWSGEITVNGVGPNLVITRFIQADDRVDGVWGGGSGLGHFSGTLSGNSFSFNGTDDDPACRLTTSGTIIMVAADSVTFTGSAGNCNGGFNATGFVKPGLP